MLPQGSESLSLFCRENAQEEIRKIADDVFSENAQIASVRDGLRLKLESGKLALNYLYFRRRADKFCSLRGSAYWQFERLQASTQEIKEKVLGEMLKCELIVGVVAKPAFDFDQRFVDLVFRIAINLDGYVFNGTHLLDATGSEILG